MNAPSPNAPSKKLLLPDDGPLSDGLLIAFERILGYARDQASKVGDAPKVSVHEFRKSIRRARALLKLMRDLIPAEDYLPLAEELRGSVKETSILRDVDVLTGHVEGLPDLPAERSVREALRAHLTQRQAEQASNASVEVLGHAAARVAPVPDRLREVLPRKLGPRTLHDALEKSYRRVRRTFRAAAHDVEDAEAIHTHRKRVKELRYSLELLRQRTRSPEPLERLALLAEELGALTDINVLRDYVRSHLPQLGECDPEPLLQRLDHELVDKTGQLVARVDYLMTPEPRPWAEAVLGPRPKKKRKGKDKGGKRGR